MELTKREKRKLRLEKLRQESREVQKEYEQRVDQQKQFQPAQKKSRWKVYLGVIGIIIVAIAAYSVYSATRPGPYDGFAKCLTEKGAVVYGAIEWCHYTQAQKGMFGNSWKYLNYQDFTKLTGIKKTPTWVINGKWYENVQSFDTLAALTGCKL